VNAAGLLFLVGTPIGNLDDMTFRAVEVLRGADAVAAENLRHTRGVLKKYGITARLISYREENSHRQGPAVIDTIKAGKTVALVTDAGMPGISDPGARLVSLALDEGVEVRVIPGPSALLAALVISGLPTVPFHFEGFLPRTSAKRRAHLRRLASLESTLVFYEAPHRVRECLEDMVHELGNRNCAVAREITKAYEEILRGPLTGVLAGLTEPRGEYVLVVSGFTGKTEVTDGEIQEYIKDFRVQGFSSRESIIATAKALGVPRKRVYRLAHS
jgi:16S rRNA (cytidine1402-2'-O)-methyltransferase